MKKIYCFLAANRSVLFEKSLSSGLKCNCSQQHGALCGELAMQRNDKT